jgi:CspA family cold shock protein
VSEINPITDSAPESEEAVEAHVKWFNPRKGFGFVVPTDGTTEAFLHISALVGIGLQDAPRGAKVVCAIGDGPKGRQVTQVFEVDTESLAPEPTGEEGKTGEVKWFRPDKGFGFVTPDDGGQDVFVHKSVLERCGLYELGEGARVQMTVRETPKGREAIWVGVI